MSTLSDKVAKYNIPAIPYGAQGDVVLVFRLPSETRTAGGLFVPEEHAEPKPCGVLVEAGLAALDVLADHLEEVGDTVWFGRFAGYEKEIERDPENKGRKILQLRVADILGSVEQIERRKAYDVVRDEETGEHAFVLKEAKKARRAS